MATYDTTTHPLAFRHMEGGMKTVYVTPNKGQFKVVTSGDRIEFDDLGYITVGTIRTYDSLDDLIEAEGYSNVIPEAEDPAEAIDAIRASSEWVNGAEADGVIAFRIRSTKRKS